MDWTELVKPEKIPSLAAGLVIWAWFFAWAPSRCFKAGIALEDPPIFLKLPPFKWFQRLALLGVIFIALQLDLGKTISEIAPDRLIGPAVAALLSIILLFALPEMTAHGRIQREESPGEWKTPMLVLFRWIWLGLMLLLALPGVEEFFGGVSPAVGAGLAVAGALIFLLWWGLPGMAVARLAEDDDPLAISILSTVRWIGLPAWLRFKIQSGSGGKVSAKSGEQKLCPTCMRPIDAIDAYESLKFDACPHCTELIPPVFNIEDYIKHYADRIKELSDAKASGRKASRPGKHENDIVQRIMRAMLTMAVRDRATDLHLVAEGQSFMVRGRTDGILYTMLDLPEELMRPMISSIKVQCNMDIAERRKPQDGSFKTTTDDKKLDVRVNTSPSPNGETASLRLLYRQEVLGSLDKLGMSRRNHRILKEYITRPHGMILVTGPTGSGKSTTLYNALGAIADGKRNIITLEDPIEFKIDGLNQMQVDASKNFGFASGLRSILRQDPDVIMVGEVRDSETAKMAIDAAMTGHLVFTTLHTIDTTTSIGRLFDLGVDPHRHAEALLLIIAQRLVRLNCRHCLETYEVTSEQFDAMGLAGGPEKMLLKRGIGCPRCHETGYYEREGIYEILTPDDQLRTLICAKSAPAEIRREARRQGMRTLLEDGLTKAILGRTTIDEVMRVTN